MISRNWSRRRIMDCSGVSAAASPAVRGSGARCGRRRAPGAQPCLRPNRARARRTRCHALTGAIEIVLRVGPHDADVQQRLAVPRLDCQRPVELRQRTVRLVHVVVADAEVGAGVDVPRIDLQRLFVPTRRVLEPFGVEVEVAELGAHAGVARIAIRRLLERGGTRLRRPARRSADSGPARAAAPPGVRPALDAQRSPAGCRRSSRSGRRRRRRRSRRSMILWTRILWTGRQKSIIAAFVAAIPAAPAEIPSLGEHRSSVTGAVHDEQSRGRRRRPSAARASTAAHTHRRRSRRAGAAAPRIFGSPVEADAGGTRARATEALGSTSIGILGGRQRARFAPIERADDADRAGTTSPRDASSGAPRAASVHHNSVVRGAAQA